MTNSVANVTKTSSLATENYPLVSRQLGEFISEE